MNMIGLTTLFVARLKKYVYKSSLRQKFASGVLWTTGTKVWLVLLNLAFNMLLVRVLSPNDVGNFFLIVSIWNILGTLTIFGLPKTTVKFIAETNALNSNQTAGVATRILGFTGLNSAIGGLLFVGIKDWLAEQVFHFPYLKDVLGLLLIWIFFTNLQRVIAEVFRGLQDFHWANVFGTQQVATRTLFVGMVFITWLTAYHASLSQVILWFAIANGITFLAAVGIFFYRFRGWTVGHIPFRWGDLIALAWPLWVSSLGFLARKQADVLILGMFRPANEVALYGIAVRLTQFASTPLLVVNGVLPPFIVDLYTSGRKRQLEHLLRMASSGFLLFAFGICIVLVFFAPLLLTQLFGTYYAQAYAPLVVLLAGMVVNVSTGACVWVLNMTGHEKVNMIVSLTAGVVQVLLMYILAEKLGVFGVSLVVTSVLILQMVFISIYAWRVVGIRTWPYLPAQVWHSLTRLSKSQG
ncbi:MAG: hypothetical protein D6732_19615 [Methanobacteriota archaeon]|nr:MAG: hypothetical protein D6732_19615 [Euryarchaeota archaeon]